MTDTDHRPPPPPPPILEPRGEIAGGTWRLGLMAAAVVALGVLAGVGWVLVIGALVVMIFLHELGHFLTAKASGMKATEFFLGFGPKLWSFRRGETEYGVKLLPFGAYVRIIGMHNLEEVPPADEPRTYRQQSFPRRLLVASAGSGMHFLQAFVLFAVVFGGLGVTGGSHFATRLGGPELDPQTWFVGEVSEGSAAEAAGLLPDDVIVEIDGEPVVEFADVGPLVHDRAGDRVPVVVERDGQRVTLEPTIGERPDQPGVGFLGVGSDYPELSEVRVGPLAAVGHAGEETIGGIGLSIKGIGQFFTGGLPDFADQVLTAGDDPDPQPGSGGSGGTAAPSDGDENRVISILGAARILEDIRADGYASFFILLATLNLFIGVFNLVPLLPLDGGHVVVAIYERLRSRRGRRYFADISRLMPVAYATVFFLLLLGLSSLYLDIRSPLDIG